MQLTKKAGILLATIAAVLALAVPTAQAHVHLGNPSDQCGRGNGINLGLLNPAGKNVPSNPQAGDSPAPYRCNANR